MSRLQPPTMKRVSCHKPQIFGLTQETESDQWNCRVTSVENNCEARTSISITLLKSDVIRFILQNRPISKPNHQASTFPQNQAGIQICVTRLELVLSDSELCHQTQICVTRLRLVPPDSDFVLPDPELCHQTQTCATRLRLVSPTQTCVTRTQTCVTRLRVVSPTQTCVTRTQTCVNRLRIVSPDSDDLYPFSLWVWAQN